MKVMKLKWFMTCWLVCTVLMYTMSFLWHGVLLNDYVNIRIPMVAYFALSTFVYLFLGLALTLLYKYTLEHELRYKGLFLGACLGFFIYLIAFVLGVSFNQSSASHVAVDFLWQMVEQGIGGASVAVLHGLLIEQDKVKRANQ